MMKSLHFLANAKMPSLPTKHMVKKLDTLPTCSVLFPCSYARGFGIVMMSLHQAVAFGLFAGPLFHMWEKVGSHS